jgi:hypothetical protein
MTAPKTKASLVNVVYILIDRELHDIEMDLRECTCPDVVARAVAELRELHEDLALMEGSDELVTRIERLLVEYGT